MFLYFYIGAGVILLAGALLFYNFFTHRISHYRKKISSAIQIKDFITALEYSKKLIATHPRQAEYHMQLAEIYIKAKMITSAVDTYRNMLASRIFSLTVREHNIRERLALINLEQGKIVEAFRDLYRIYRTSGNSPLALALLGKIYGSQKKYARAEEFLKKAVNLKPKEAEYHYQLGLLFLDTANLDNAYHELEKAYQLDPGHIKAAYFLALASRQKGLEEKAKLLLQRLNLITPLKDLPDNITQIHLMGQNMLKFEIDEEEERLIQELTASQTSKARENVAQNVSELLSASLEVFTSTAYYVIDRMGYLVQKDIKNRFFDPANEMDVMAIAKKEKDNPEAHRYYIQFTRAKTELGPIPFHDFIEKLHETGIKNGVLIITSTFNPKITEELGKIKKNIILVDAMKLGRYLA